MSKTKELTVDMYSLAKAQEAVNTTNKSLRRSFAEASNGVGKYSKAWTMFSRVLSGSSLWRLQNYLRSVGQAMDFYYSKTEEATKAANEQAKAMGELTNNIDEVESQLKLLKQAGTHKELIESNLEYKITFDALKAATASAKDTAVEAAKKEAEARELALARTRNAYDMTLKKLKGNLVVEGKELQKSLAAEKKIRDKADMAKYKKLAKDQKRAISLVRKLRKMEAKGKVDKSVLDRATKEERSARGRMGQFSKSVGGGMADKLKEQERGTLTGLAKLIKGDLGGAKSDIGKSLSQTFKPIFPMVKLATKFFTMPLKPFVAVARGVIRFVKNPKKALGNLSNKLKNLRTTIRNNGGFIATIWKGVGPIFSIVGKVAKMAMLYSMYFVLFLVGALLAFVFIKKIFEKAEVLSVIMETLSGVFEGIKEMFGGAILIFEAFFGGGTLKERFEKLFKGILGLYKGLGKIIFSVLKGAVKLAVNLIVAYFSMMFEIYLAIIDKVTDPSFWKDTVLGFIKKIPDYLGMAVTAMFNKIKDFWGTVKEYFSDKIQSLKNALSPSKRLKSIGGKIRGFFGMQTGGIAQGGMTMVGERGPELINLPKGTSVHSNDTTKTMMGGHVTNNISVNVNGRLGASDTELRDIAKKIGRMVSTEINRTTSSSTNVRF